MIQSVSVTSTNSKPLSCIFHDFLSTGQFILEWKKGNIISGKTKVNI